MNVFRIYKGIVAGALIQLCDAHPVLRNHPTTGVLTGQPSILIISTSLTSHIEKLRRAAEVVIPAEYGFSPQPSADSRSKQDHKHTIVASVLAVSLMLLAILTVRIVIPASITKLARKSVQAEDDPRRPTNPGFEGLSKERLAERAQEIMQKGGSIKIVEGKEKGEIGGYVMVILEDDSKSEVEGGRGMQVLLRRPPAVVLKERLPLSPIVLAGQWVTEKTSARGRLRR
ncbi:hypothetical protein EW146_g2091 [Bondarzewia mesenterica]|uniref:Uncharacterized protein n=1 Tax=Bondarzewia mesenterica TaxID=1095465 RepID=A0A4S4M824_9AGAM|nr:hypothetical protein EW146_g2091 [Bondarzewia mesenterica]